MKTVAQLLNAKQNQQVYTIGADEMVLDALRLMAEKNIGALLVVNHGEVVGVVSERDYARKMVLKGRSSIGTPISAIMSAPVVSVDSKQSVDTCMNLMTDRHLRHLPVVAPRKSASRRHYRRRIHGSAERPAACGLVTGKKAFAIRTLMSGKDWGRAGWLSGTARTPGWRGTGPAPRPGAGAPVRACAPRRSVRSARPR